MIDFAIGLYAACLFFLYKTSPVVGDNSVFGFRKLTFLISAAELPYLLFISHNPDSLHPLVQEQVADFEAVFLKFLGLKSLFLTAFSITAFHLRRGFSVGRQNTTPVMKSVSLPSLDLLLSLLMLVLTLLTFALLLMQVGGLYDLLLRWSIKTEVLRGTALFRISNLAFGILAIGFFINYIGRRPKVSLIERVALTLIIVIVFAVLMSVGERKNPVLVVVFAMVTWHFRVRPIKLVTPRNIALFVFFIGFAAIFPDLRKPDAMLLFFDDPVQMFVNAIENWWQVFARMSDVDTSLFIYSYFDSFDKFWFGATWPDLFTGLIPSSVLQSKPPVDEGVYIYAMAHGYVFTPPTPFRDLIPVGWPLSRVTGPFAQFGIVGVFVGGLATGLVMRMLAKITFRTRSPSSLFIYTWAQLTGFGLTNAFIFNLALILLLLMPVHWYYRAAERRYFRRNQQRTYVEQMQHAHRDRNPLPLKNTACISDPASSDANCVQSERQ